MKTTCQVMIAVFMLTQTLYMVAKDVRQKSDSDTAIGLFLTASIISAMCSVLYFAGSFSELIGD